MNPMLPIDMFIPDGEAHVMPDGRLYLYGSLDLKDGNTYCSERYHVFSTDDMVNWVDHGESFRIDDGMLYAPDCIHKDGKYYLYYCTAGNGEYTAVSDSPAGPFVDPQPMEIANGDSIDPAIFVDDDGQAYYFWGQFSLKGARLNPDMRSIDPATVTENIITEEHHGFHEGASIRKRGDTYYLVYTDISRGRATCLGYATSKSPLGPYKKGGIIIDNTFCDPQSWNDHGSIEEYKGQWYVFYHRSSRNGNVCRRACCEKIYFDENGCIGEVEMTSQGAGTPLKAFEKTMAYLACRMRGGAYICTDEVTQERLTHCGGPRFWPGWAEYKYLDFGSGTKKVCLEAKGKGTIRVRQEDRTVFADVNVDLDDYAVLETECVLPGGVHGLWLFFEGEGMDVRWVQFE